MNKVDRKREKSSQDYPERSPIPDFSDAVNRSLVGNPGALAKGSCLTKILNLVLIIVILLVIAQCTK